VYDFNCASCTSCSSSSGGGLVVMTVLGVIQILIFIAETLLCLNWALVADILLVSLLHSSVSFLVGNLVYG